MMEQSGSSWLEWRNKGIGSSDAPVIWGTSPYSTPYKLWEIKTGRFTSSWEGNWATQRGHRLEPIARAHYELINGEDMPATCLVHPEAPWLRASLDGFNGTKILEIKCPGKVDHALACAGRIPEKYYPQLQHQMIVAEADEVDYFSFDGNDGVTVNVKYDAVFAKEYLSKAYEFWAMVESDVPPPFVRRDYTMVRDNDLLLKIKLWRMTGNDEYKDEILWRFQGKRVRKGIYYIDEHGLHVRPEF